LGVLEFQKTHSKKLLYFIKNTSFTLFIIYKIAKPTLNNLSKKNQIKT
jgi:hypothetical protein